MFSLADGSGGRASYKVIDYALVTFLLFRLTNRLKRCLKLIIGDYPPVEAELLM